MKKIILILAASVMALIIGVRAFATTSSNTPQEIAPEPPRVAQATLTVYDTTQNENVPETTTEPPQTVEMEPPAEQEWIEAVATAYCSCEKCCGEWATNRPDGIVCTASGAVAEEGVTIAADWDVLPPGTTVFIDGLGERVVQDRGAAVKGNAVDVYFQDHNEALLFGRQTVRLYIVAEGDPV